MFRWLSEFIFYFPVHGFTKSTIISIKHFKSASEHESSTLFSPVKTSAIVFCFYK